MNSLFTLFFSHRIPNGMSLSLFYVFDGCLRILSFGRHVIGKCIGKKKKKKTFATEQKKKNALMDTTLSFFLSLRNVYLISWNVNDFIKQSNGGALDNNFEIFKQH